MSRSFLYTLLFATVGQWFTPSADAASSTLSLENDQISIAFRVDNRTCHAVGLLEKRSGRTLALESDDFSIGIEGEPALSSAHFEFKRAEKESIPNGRRLRLCFTSPASKSKLHIIYELGDHDFFVRRRLELTVTAPLALRRVDVWIAAVNGTASHQGFGEPVFLEETFWGLEYPVAIARLPRGSCDWPIIPAERSKTASPARRPWSDSSNRDVSRNDSSNTCEGSRKRPPRRGCLSTTTPGGP